MRSLGIALIALALVAPGATAGTRRRTSHHPATPCSYSLVPTWGTANIAPSGITRALVLVYGQTQECSQWGAYSNVDWVTVEAAPMAAQPGALVTVIANPTSQTRSATLIIAGIRLNLTQDGATTISPPIAGNLLVNGTFDKDVSAWGWFSRFPNALGTPQWSQLDANGSPASGSMLLRDTDFLASQSFQQLQCVRLNTGGGFYEFGTKVRTGGANGEAAIALLTYASTDCSDPYLTADRKDRVLRPSQSGVWTKYDFNGTISGNARSALIVVASAADAPPFEAWFDDVYLREVK
ncbi:MAG TPA: BACON domain-containing carbohydrate-binding protein [Thermoanaerobaculia bacterium]|nr:BACON domain-containing carbohydrate-binding protein [Thermoanaerobaculia bacterium]